MKHGKHKIRIDERVSALPVADDVAETAERIRRAILTLSVLPDRESRWLYVSDASNWPETVRSIHEAYGFEAARPPKFRPTAADVDDCLVVLGWLAAYERERSARGIGPRDVRIIRARAFGYSWVNIATVMGCSERSAQRWFDGAIALIHTAYVSSRKKSY